VILYDILLLKGGLVMGKIYTPDEIATGLKVSKLAVYKWLQKGDLKAFKAGKMWRITQEDLEAFIGRSIPWEDE
jgi:excisionase family DNA binding protein